jgi:Ca-activated chloride channel family protein
MNAAVDSFSAKGETPIAYSMGKAVDDLGNFGKRVLILVSDGQETCGGDPCEVAKKLAKQGVDLQFNGIGLEVNAKARSQLQVHREGRRGHVLRHQRHRSLGSALRKLTQRALRPFEVSGVPVKATTRPADAPTIGAGQYRDSYDTSGTRATTRSSAPPAHWSPHPSPPSSGS